MDLTSLENRYRKCDKRWTKALVAKGYPRDDDPEESALEGRPHSERETRLVLWADLWRRGLHAYETLLLAHPDVRRGLAEGQQLREPLTLFESTRG